MNALYQRCGHVSVLTGYVSANGHNARHQSEGIVPCGDCGSANKAEYLTILEFTHFCEFFSFNYVEENRKEKTLIQKITVAVAFELETGNTKNPDIKVNMDTIE